MKHSCPWLPTLLLFLSAVSVPAAVELPSTLPPHPRLLFAQRDVPVIKQRIATQPWARARFDELKSQADAWLKRDVQLPAKGGQWYHWYSCPKHGARLRTEGPTRHVCPVDGEVLSGYPYDDVVLMGEHSRLAGAIRTLGMVYQLTGDTPYAATARKVLLAYAGRYSSYPLHTIRGEAKVGGGKVGPQTLDESVWLITMVEGADCIWDTLTPEEQDKVKSGLLYPATDLIRQHKPGIHNIQCWKNSAVGLTGLLLNDTNLVQEALHAQSGYYNQMAKGVSADGAWYEGAWGYHFYTLSALLHLTEGALNSGLNLYGPELKRMFDAPLAMAMPDLVLPAFNDSPSVSMPGSAGLYETAYARYQDPRYRLVLASRQRVTDSALLHGVPDLGKPTPFAPVSRNFPASGNAILAEGTGRDAVWFCMKYGPHGGGHGHPDKLNFVLYGLGRILAPDPGTANYGVPIQGGWYRTTLAHNTLSVDQQSQKPAEGQCDAFVSARGFSSVMAHAGNIHDGLTFYRTVTLLGSNLFLFIDQIQADKEHSLDLAYHHLGTLTPPPGAKSAELPNKPGYSFLRDAKTLDTANGLQLTFKTADGPPVVWTMAAGTPTTFLTGTGVGAHTEDRVPLVISRRKTNATAYLWCLWLNGKPGGVTLEAAPVQIADGRPANADETAALTVKTPTGIYLLAANPAGAKASVRDQAFETKIACFMKKGDGQFVLQHAAP